MRRRLHALAWTGLLSGVFFASCLARRETPYVRQTDDDAGPPDATQLQDGAVADVAPDALDIAPHAVLGIDPPHGPFAGGTRVIIRGNGFDSNARVWFGDVEVPREDIIPVDPQRIQINKTPPGDTGAVDLRVQNGDAESTSATLPLGYTYDRFYADPLSGPTSGGTVITIRGDHTEWDEDTTVEIDRQPCTDLTLLSPTELTCVTPPSEVGDKVLSVISADEREDVLDGFSYGQSDDGFKRALWGERDTEQLTVVAYDNFEGQALPGVAVLMGDDVDSGQVKYTDKNPRTFTAYAMGLLRGVAAKAGQRAEDVYIEVDVPLDHALSITLDPPTPGPRGPDRIRASVAVQIENQGFAIFPGGSSAHALPGATDFSFVGVPPLVGSLAGTQYVLSARAATGAQEAAPLSVLGKFSTTSGDQQDLGGFVPVPVLTTPAPNAKWDLSTLSLQPTKGGQSVELTVINIQAGGGLYQWTLVAPGSPQDLKLPDLKKLASDAALPVGSLSVETTLAHILGDRVDVNETKEFDYGALRYRQLTTKGWNAYATDSYLTQH